jgi:hypothetical protein
MGAVGRKCWRRQRRRVKRLVLAEHMHSILEVVVKLCEVREGQVGGACANVEWSQPVSKRGSLLDDS